MSSMKKDNTGYDIKQLFIGMLLAHRFKSNLHGSGHTRYMFRTYPVHVPDQIVGFPMLIAKEVFKYTGIDYQIFDISDLSLFDRVPSGS
jgi:hypothetical protein